MKCPHCGGAIDVIAANPEPDASQRELPFVFELRLPSKYAKKILANEGSEIHAGAAAHHEHGHEHDLGKDFEEHEHDHEHHVGELTAAEQDLLDQIEELIANENRTQHFRTTWILRIHDYPNQVFAAIGETRAAKREGRVRRSTGGFLNWHFERFRETALAKRKEGEVKNGTKEKSAPSIRRQQAQIY